METNIITIVGLQRTGLSIALALKDGPLDFTVVGCDSRKSALRDPLAVEAVDRVEADLTKACVTADIIVLAMPSIDLEATLRKIGGIVQEHALIIDLTALKEPGNKLAKEHVRQGHYIGARPVFAASTFNDLQDNRIAARADLFKNSVFCIMPTPDTDPEAVETTVRFGHLLGAVPYFVDSFEFDQLSLGVETMPTAAAAALFRSAIGRSGWRDILRFADLPFAVGTLALEDNAEDMAYHMMHDSEGTMQWLDNLVDELLAMKQLIGEGETEILSAYLTELNRARSAWLEERSKNDWDEAEADELKMPSFREQLFGGLLGRGGSSQ